jgi:hypothetical protein
MRVQKPHPRRLRAGSAMGILLLGLLLGGAAAACSSAETGAGSPAMATMTPAAADQEHVGMTTGKGMGDAMSLPTPEEIAAAWDGRPDFVRSADRATQEAYAFAVARPDIVQWMPCYCGCAAIEHRSNLDCFLKPRASGGAITFEEHASYCDVCVKTALTAKQMLAQGATLTQMRQAVDSQFGGNGAQGTPTQLPPS